jgi:integrase
MGKTNWLDGCTPTKYEGIWKFSGGYRVRVRAVDPRTGTMKEVNRKFPDVTMEQAVVRQAELKEEIRRGGPEAVGPKVRYAGYAASLYERKIAKGKLTSAKTQQRWSDTQDLHLIPHFGEFFVDAIRRGDIEAWLTRMGKRVGQGRGQYSPNTVNSWLSILLTTLRSAVVELDLTYDPTLGIEPLDTSAWHTYTEEEPNSLTLAEVPGFLTKARELYPQNFAMLALGLATGRRPCELRPLRRGGESPDIIWKEGVLLIRRSEGLGVAIERTKTKRRLRIPLPKDLMDILRWHVLHLPAGPMRKSELLFPSETGGFRAPSVLDKPIRAIAKAAEIGKHLSPRFMRRTFQDLGRAAKVHDFVVEAISGHATAEMHRHYSTVGGEEIREGLARVVSMAEFAKAHQARAGGYPGGYTGRQKVPAKSSKSTEAA